MSESDGRPAISLLSTVSMAGSIRLFQFLQKFHRILGIYPSKPSQKQCSINPINTIWMMSIAQLTFTTIAFLVLEATTVFEYGFGCFMCTACISVPSVYFLFIGQLENTLNFIGNCEKFVKSSEYRFECQNINIRN